MRLILRPFLCPSSGLLDILCMIDMSRDLPYGRVKTVYHIFSFFTLDWRIFCKQVHIRGQIPPWTFIVQIPRLPYFAAYEKTSVYKGGLLNVKGQMLLAWHNQWNTDILWIAVSYLESMKLSSNLKRLFIFLFIWCGVLRGSQCGQHCSGRRQGFSGIFQAVLFLLD